MKGYRKESREQSVTGFPEDPQNGGICGKIPIGSLEEISGENHLGEKPGRILKESLSSLVSNPQKKIRNKPVDESREESFKESQEKFLMACRKVSVRESREESMKEF